MLAVAAATRTTRALARIQAPAAALAAVVSLSEVAAGYGAATAGATGLRFLDVVAAAAIFYLTTPVDEVGDVLLWLGVPEEAVTWIVLSLRFLPTIARDLSRVIDAQSSRGMGAGGPLDWIKGIPSLVTPTMVISILRGREVAEALEIRGYRPGRRPRGGLAPCAAAAASAALLALLSLLA